MQHIPVLLQKTIESLAIKPGDIFFDGTLGGGGHSDLVYQLFGNKVTIIGIDRDSSAVEQSRTRLEKLGCRPMLEVGNFRDLDIILDKLKISKVDRILFDLGLSSNQFEESGRGFTFQKNEPLLMTMASSGSGNEVTASEIVNTWEGENIATILKAYGEERFAERIAQGIVTARSVKPIKTTFDLVEIIKRATPKFYHFKKIHPATKTFQALRITVNDEIVALQEGLQKGFLRLETGGRIAVISFHSIEDRVVKHFFREKAKAGQATLITKRPLVPSREETQENPRSRSAKLRILQRNFVKNEK